MDFNLQSTSVKSSHSLQAIFIPASRARFLCVNMGFPAVDDTYNILPSIKANSLIIFSDYFHSMGLNLLTYRRLYQGVDFDCGLVSMRVNLYNAAKRKGINYIMALSNYANNQELVKKAYQNGANDFLPKSQLKKYTDQFIKKIVNKNK